MNKLEEILNKIEICINTMEQIPIKGAYELWLEEILADLKKEENYE